jgi:hypothetical protein
MQLQQLALEVEPDECGYHVVIIDLADDAVLFVTNSHNRPEDAERDARRWIDKNA